MDPVVILAHAMFDVDSTGRLSEHPEAEAEYLTRARSLLYMIREFRPQAERDVLADEIRRAP